MFGHEAREKDSGRFVIEDLDPDAFRDFLEYVYTGRVEAFSEENAFGLFRAADKYDIQELKSEAFDFIQRTLSVDYFCDVVRLLLHQENELHDLMNRAVDFFKKNLYNIITTEKWQVFLKENGKAANDLLIKALAPTENE